jgi:lipopolysaccharide export system protein LptC
LHLEGSGLTVRLKWDLYSKFIGLLKVALASTAVALMSSVFLLARAPVKDGSILYAEYEQVAREQRMSELQSGGLSDDGSIVKLDALVAVAKGDVTTAETLTANIVSADGTYIDIRAIAGEINSATQTLRLTDLVWLKTSSNYEMEAFGLTADMNTGRIVSDGAVEVQAPYGTLTAGQLIIETPVDSEGQKMVFQNGVELVYIPGNP